MSEGPLLGAKVRALRRREQMTQIALADRLGISPSYLNLIENNRRPLTAPLLLKLAQIFQLDLQTFAASEEDARLSADLLEAFGDPLFDGHAITNQDLRELVASSPSVARAVLTLYRSYVAARDSAETLGERLAGDGFAGLDASRLPSEEVIDLVQRARVPVDATPPARRRERARGVLLRAGGRAAPPVDPAAAGPDLTLLARRGLRAVNVPDSELYEPRKRTETLCEGGDLNPHGVTR